MDLLVWEEGAARIWNCTLWPGGSPLLRHEIRNPGPPPEANHKLGYSGHLPLFESLPSTLKGHVPKWTSALFSLMKLVTSTPDLAPENALDFE